MPKRAPELPRVLLLYTGGTFGMDSSHTGKAGQPMVIPKLSPAALQARLKQRVPELQELARCDIEILLNRDSAHVGPEEWKIFARRIRAQAARYQGIVLLHGTDTLAYTASALAFLLRPCPVPVILTGAQRPLSAIRTDARRNLISAVEIAARGPRPLVNQVLVFFDDRLLLGNRARKRSASEFAAFESPKAEPLAIVGTEIRYRQGYRVKPARGGPKITPAFSPKVAMLHLTPSAPYAAIAKLLPELDGLVLVTFPSGTGPGLAEGFIPLLKEAEARGVPVVVTTEGHSPGLGRSSKGFSGYEAAKPFTEMKCLSAGEMTPECAFVKASLLLGQKGGKKRFRENWMVQLAGEG
jgi:L-asparaginase